MFTFLLSSERSGSNFITKLLNAHSTVIGPSPKHLFSCIGRNLFRYGDLKKQANLDMLIGDVLPLINSNFSKWQSNYSITDFDNVNNVKEIINIVYQKELDASKATIAFIKENHVYEYIDFLLALYPKSKFVYLVRDPRDMALSWKKTTSMPGGIVTSAERWSKDQKHFLKIYANLKSQNLAMLLTYEELTKTPHQCLTRVCDFLGLTFEPNMLNFHKNKLTIENANNHPAWSNLSKSIISNNSLKYKKELSHEEIAVIEKLCHEEMKKLNYEIETDTSLLTNGMVTKLKKQEVNLEYIPHVGIDEIKALQSVFYNR